MSSAQPLQVLAISRDRLGLDPESLPARRWLELVKQGIELEVWILASEETHWEQPGIRVFGTGGGSFFARALRVRRRAPVVTPQLVTTQDAAELGYLSSKLAKQFHARFEVQDHAGTFDGSGMADESLGFIRRPLAYYFAKRADAVRTVNPQSATWLAANTNAFSYWLPIVPRQDLHGLKRQTVPGSIVCVARLVPVKRLRLLVEAFARLRKQVPSVTLTLVGDGPERASLVACVQEMGLASAVTFTGMADPVPYLVGADVFVLLSRHEGWGIAAIEAAMVGVPVVMTDTGCARFLEERGNAFVIRHASADSIAQVLQKQLGKRATPLVDVLTPELAAEKQAYHWKSICRL